MNEKKYLEIRNEAHVMFFTIDIVIRNFNQTFTLYNIRI